MKPSLGEHPKGIANVLPPGFEIRKAPQFAARLFERGYIAQTPLCGLSVAALLGLHLEVKAQLTFKVTI